MEKRFKKKNDAGLCVRGVAGRYIKRDMPPILTSMCDADFFDFLQFIIHNIVYDGHSQKLIT